MRYIILILIVLLMINSCSPVRNHSVAKKSNVNQKKSNNIQKDSVQQADVLKQRFSDTTFIVLPTVIAEKNSALSDEFDYIVNLFDTEKYDEACPKFKTYAETLTPGDSLYYEAKFFHSECLIQQNRMIEGKEILLQIENDERLTDLVRERVLVRMGQIYCVEKNFEKAESYFTHLKKRYPKSIYIPLADCNVIK